MVVHAGYINFVHHSHIALIVTEFVIHTLIATPEIHKPTPH